jgi:nitrate reductase assembly molybdenum cofactor insertion protein NarJ
MQPGVLDLAREAAEWRLIGLLFEQPSAVWREQIAALGAEVSDQTLRRAAKSALAEASEELYHSFFGPGGPASPREASYFDNIQLGYLIAELCAHYEAFAYEPSLGEAPDHVAAEAGFIAFLRLKEAFALAEGDEDHAAVTREAAQHFMSEHLARMASTLAEKFVPSGVEYLTLASAALAARSGTMSQPPFALPVLADLNETNIECGCDTTDL